MPRKDLRKIAGKLRYTPADYKRLEEKAERYGFVLPERDGILTEAYQGTAHGVLSVAKGVGSTLAEAGITDKVDDYMGEVMNRNQHLRPDPEYKALSIDPANIARTIGTGVGQSAVALGAGVATTAATGGNVFAGGAMTTGLIFAQTYGDEVRDFRDAMPNQDEDVIQGLAFFSSLGQGLIESVAGPEAIASGLAKRVVTGALKEAAKKTGKQAFKQVMKEAVKGGVGEGLEEVFQGFISNTAKKIGGADIPFMTFEDAAEQFAGGFLPGAVMGGASGVVENKMTPEDTEPDAPGPGPDEEIAPRPIYSDKHFVEDTSDQAQESLQYLNTAAGRSEDTGDFVIIQPKSKATKAVSAITEELFGVKPTFFASTGEAGTDINGVIDSGDRIFVNTNTVDNTGFILGHELAHYIKRETGNAYAEFQNAVSNAVKNDNVHLQRIQQVAKDSGVDLTQEGALNEYSADVLGELFESPKFWKDTFAELESRDLGVAKRVARAVLKFINLIKSKMSGVDGALSYLENLDEIEQAAVKLVGDFQQEKADYQSNAENAQAAFSGKEVVSAPDYSEKMPNASKQYKTALEETKEEPAKPEVEPEPVQEKPTEQQQRRTETNDYQAKGKKIDKMLGSFYKWEEKTGAFSDAEFVKANQDRLDLIEEAIANNNPQLVRERLQELSKQITKWNKKKKVESNIDEPAPFITPMADMEQGKFEFSLPRKPLAETSEAKQYRDPDVPASSRVFELLGIKPGKIYADYEFLHRQHPEYFATPEDTKLAAEYVLENPDFATSEDGFNAGLVRKGNDSKHPKIKIRLEKKRNYYHIRSVHLLEDYQYSRQKKDRLSSDKTPTSDLSDNREPRTEQPASDNNIQSDSENVNEFSFSRYRQVNPFEPGTVARDAKSAITDAYEPQHVLMSDLDTEAEQIIQREGIPEIIANLDNRDWNTALNQRLIRKVMASDYVSERYGSGSKEIMDLAAKQTVSGTWLGQALASRQLDKNLNYDEMIANEILSRVRATSKHYDGSLESAKKEAEESAKLTKKLQDDYGVDPSNVTQEQIDNKKLMAAVFREISTNKATWGDKAYEFWIASILSGARTHAANTTGNIGMTAIELGPQRFAEAAVNLLVKNKKGATFGEFKEMWKALRHSLKPAWVKAVDAWKLEMPSTENELKLEMGRGPAIGGKTGRFVRAPLRLLLAADELAKAITGPMESTAMAYRIAKSEGLSGDKLKTRITELVSNPESEAALWGHERAKELAFQQDLGDTKLDGLVKLLMAGKQKDNMAGTLLKYIFPFSKTPWNLVKTGVRKTPLGSFKLAKDLIQNRSIDERALHNMAEQVLAWGTVMMISSWMDDEDDLPFITGSKPKYGSNKYKWLRQNVPPNSIRIGDQWYDYSRIEPLAGILSNTVDMIHAYNMQQDGRKGAQIVDHLVNTFRQNVRDKTFLQSIGDLIRALEGDYKESLPRYASNFAASWLPNLVRGSITSLDDRFRDRRNYEEGMAWLKDQMIFKTLEKSGLKVGMPKIDLWGDEMENRNVGAVVPPAVWKLISPSLTQPADMTARDAVIWNWNRHNPEDEYWPGLPSPGRKVSGKSVIMKGEEYQEYARRSGQIAKQAVDMAIERGRINPFNPTEDDIKLIKKIFRKSRAKAKKELFK